MLITFTFYRGIEMKNDADVLLCSKLHGTAQVEKNSALFFVIFEIYKFCHKKEW